MPLPTPAGSREGHFEWRGHDIWFMQQGSGPPLVLVHMPLVGGSSLEWQENVRFLARGHAVYALDLLGFGRSAQPLLHYTGDLYAGLLRDFQREVIAQPADLVASGNAAAFALGAAAADPDAFVRVVAICPTGLHPMLHFPGRPDPSLFLRLVGPHGNAVYERLASRQSLLYQLQTQLYYDQQLITGDLVEQYYAAAHQGPGRRYAPAAWFAGHLDWSIRDRYPQVSQPILIVWGEQSAHNPATHLVDFLAGNPGAVGRILPNTRLLPHVENPGRFNQLVSDFLLGRC